MPASTKDKKPKLRGFYLFVNGENVGQLMMLNSEGDYVRVVSHVEGNNCVIKVGKDE